MGFRPDTSTKSGRRVESDHLAEGTSMANNSDKKLPMKAILAGLVGCFVLLSGAFLIVPAFFDVHLTDALFETPEEPWMLKPEEQQRLGMSVDEMKGKHHFEQMCASCHGPWGNGGGPQSARVGGVPSLVDPEQQGRLLHGLSRKGVLKTLEEGVPGSAMPGFPHLAKHVKETIADFLAYAQRNHERLP